MGRPAEDEDEAQTDKAAMSVLPGAAPSGPSPSLPGSEVSPQKVDASAMPAEDPLAAQNAERSEELRREALRLIEEAHGLQSSGDEAASQQRLHTAGERLEESLGICPTNHKTRFLVVNRAMHSDDHTRAKEEGLRLYEDLKSSKQLYALGDAVLHLTLAHVSKMLGEVEDAIQFASEATELYDSDPHAFMILAELYESLGRDPEAEEKCKQALEKQARPDCRRSLNEQSVYFTRCCLGAALIKQAKHEEAERILLEAKASSEALGLATGALAQRHLIGSYEIQGRFEDAAACAWEVTQLEPDDEEIRKKLEILDGRCWSDVKAQHPPSRGEGDQGASGSPGAYVYGDGYFTEGCDRGSDRSRRDKNPKPRSRRNRSTSRDAMSGYYTDGARDEDAPDLAPLNTARSVGEVSVLRSGTRPGKRGEKGGLDADKSSTIPSRGVASGDPTGFCCCFERG